MASTTAGKCTTVRKEDEETKFMNSLQEQETQEKEFSERVFFFQKEFL